MLKLNNGTLSLPDGRTVCTVAATQFTLTSFQEAATVRNKDRNEEAVPGYRMDTETLEERLARGDTVAMYGLAEGRLLDGTVSTSERWWKVCAL